MCYPELAWYLAYKLTCRTLHIHERGNGFNSRQPVRSQEVTSGHGEVLAWMRYSCEDEVLNVKPTGAEFRICWENRFNTLADDDLAPVTARSSATVILTTVNIMDADDLVIYGVFVFHDERYQSPVLSEENDRNGNSICVTQINSAC